MYRSSGVLTDLMLVALLLLALPAPPSTAQNGQGGAEIPVPVLQTESSRRCADFENGDGVIDEAAFRKMAATEGCQVLKKLNIDFSMQTLIRVGVTGDCFVRASVELTRNDSTKKYTCKIKKIYGGCRAVGRFQRWVVVEKLRPEYKLEFVTTTAERDEEPREP